MLRTLFPQQFLFVEAEFSRRPVSEIKPEAASDARKSQLFPRDALRREQLCFQTFVTCCMFPILQCGAVEKMHLADLRDAKHGERPFKGNLCAGLLKRFSSGSLCSCLAIFHEACRQSPKTESGLYRAFAKENSPFPFGNAANDEFWILVVNVTTFLANVSG